MKNRQAFDELREYVREKTGRKVTNNEIYEHVAMSDSKLSKILKKDGINDFTSEEAKKLQIIFLN